MAIKWPKGKSSDNFKREVKILSRFILEGTVLCIDPASRSCGWSKYVEGKLVDKGIIKLTSTAPVQVRLPQLYDALEKHSKPDLIVLEKIRGVMAHEYLRWSVGVSVAALRSTRLLECPIGFWKAVRPDDYVKADDNDAEMLGLCVVTLAKELKDEN